ncbi:MAG: tyrosine-type recombinase/integrase [Nitrospirota bacterium]
MKGVIRPISRQTKCPTCDKKFQHLPKLGYGCPSCKTVPNRFRIDIHFQGKRYFICSDKQGQALDSFQRAIKLQAHIQTEIENHSFDPSKYIKAEQEAYYVMNLCERFLNFKINSIAPSYQKDYKRLINIAKDYFKSFDVREIRKLHLINYKEYLEKTSRFGGKTIKNIMDLFKTFLIHCKNDLEIIDTVPVFPEVEVPPFSFQWLSQQDQIALFDLLPEKDAPIFAFLMLHGCRPSEARALKVKNVDLRTQTITVTATFSARTYREKRKGKRSRPVTIPIHPEMYEYIADKVKNNLPEAFLFVNPRTNRYYSLDTLDRIWDSVREKAKLNKKLRLYDATRHSYASNLVNNNTTLYKVSKLLGHSTIKMTEKYAHSDIESLRIDIQKISLNREQTVNKSVLRLNISNEIK